YAPSSSQELVSPPISLAQAPEHVWLTWAMKYQLQSATYHHAWVEARPGAQAAKKVWEWDGPGMRHAVGASDLVHDLSAGWGLHQVDLSSFIGQTIQVVF